MKRRVNGSSTYAVDTKFGSNNTVLTYDDGPEPTRTIEVLEALAEYGATATFFVLLSRTRLKPSLVGEILSQGHEIALHGIDHRSLIGMHEVEVFERTFRAKLELEEMIDQPVRWFRPPYGHQTLESWYGIVTAGLTPVMWNVQCGDWVDAINEDYEQYLAEVREITKPGSIILAHDNCASKQDGAQDLEVPKFSTGKLARLILEINRVKGFSCSSLGGALENGRLLRKPWFQG